MDSMIDAPLDWNEISRRAAVFVLRHKNDSDEQAQKQTFWNDFFHIFGVDRTKVASFEKATEKIGDSTGFIDLFWPNKLVVEHKSLGKNLDSAFCQALGYTFKMKKSMMPRYIIVSDFKHFRLTDLEENEEDEFTIEDLVINVRLFDFIAGYEKQKFVIQDPVNIEAAEKMAKLHDALKRWGYSGHVLEVYLVRLVFCMFAEDTEIFKKNQFSDHIRNLTTEDGANLASEIDAIFWILNKPREERMGNLSDKMNFPYINGGLFNERLPVASFDGEMRTQLLDCSNLNWDKISPAIFGSMFQGVMDSRERRELGAHYTSEENILKLIDPLFMDDLRLEFEKVKFDKKRLEKFWDRLVKIKILDPACGCGNFLIIAYRELRLLEMDVIAEFYESQTTIGLASRIDVDQFFGIEIEEFPAEIARTAMWLMDHLMNLKSQDRFGFYEPRIPLKTHANILNGNALTTDWNDLVSKEELTYIIGNPPFSGGRKMTAQQKKDAVAVFGKIKLSNSIDYVGAWYHKAAKYIQNTDIKVGFVSTNSITQGEQVAPMWKKMLGEYGIEINLAHQTFKWSNEAKKNAGVYCIIIGFARKGLNKQKMLYGMESQPVKAANINPYLVDAPDIFVENRSRPICNVPLTKFGNMPNDGGNYVFSKTEMDEFVAKEPQAEKFFRKFIGAEEFINGKERFCLWLKGADSSELRKCPMVMERISKVRELRLQSSAEPTRKKADTPQLFFYSSHPKSTYILIPAHSSEKRDYIPIGFMEPEVIATNSAVIIPNATLYHFGVITSKMHMVWMRYTCGRLESRYRYSGGVVYNNFPWPNVSDDQKKLIENAAQEVLDARKLFPKNTFADLYDPLTMPIELRKAHDRLDRSVEKSYSNGKFKSDPEIMAFLFGRYLETMKSAK